MSNRYVRWAAILILGLMVSCRNTGSAVIVPEQVPVKYRELIQQSLEDAGGNAPELLKVLTTLKGEELDGASFLIATMPFPDLISIDADFLLEHIHYTYLVKNKYPWMKNMPEDVFLGYVLPYRASSESLTHCRKYFYEQLDPLVQNCQTMFEVAYHVDLWLGGERKSAKPRVHFETGEARNESPFDTLFSGHGRCGEETIIYLSAVRSVGIPARDVWTPRWATCDNNHAWTEFWAEGKWYAIGSCETDIRNALAETAGLGWFNQLASTAAAIYALRLGQPSDTSTIYKSTKKESMINVISNFSLTSQVVITVLAADGKPATDTPVALSVVNWGAFSRVASKRTDKLGQVSFTTGVGDYFISSGQGEFADGRIISTAPDKKVEVTLQLAQANYPSGYYILKYPPAAEAYRAFKAATTKTPASEPVIPERIKNFSAEHAPGAPPETYYYEEFKIEEHPEVTELIGEKHPAYQNIIRVLKEAGGNWHSLVEAIKTVPNEGKEDLLWLVSQMDYFDALEFTKELLLEDVAYARLARNKLPAKIADDIYRANVLSYKVQYMHIYPWRKDLYNMLGPVVYGDGKDLTLTGMAKRLNEWIEKNIKLIKPEPSRFTYLTNPRAVFTSKRADEILLAWGTVCALRSLGIPARLKETWAEFYDGKDWQPLYPLDSKNLGKTQATDVAAKQYVKKGAVRIITTRNGFPYQTGDDPNFGVAPFNEGGWDSILDEIESQNGWLVVVPGTYLATASARNANGDVLVYTQPITVTSGKGVTMEVPLDLPLEMASTGERVVRQLATLPDFTLNDKTGKDYRLKSTLTDTNVLLVFFTLEAEPSLRMLPLIQATADEARSVGVEIWTVLVDGQGENDPRLNGFSLPVLLDKNQAVAKQFVPEVATRKKEIMPSVLLVNKKGEIVFWKEGYNLAIDSALKDLYASLTGRPANVTLEGLQKRVKMREENVLAGLEYAQEGIKYLQGGEYQKAVESYKKATELITDNQNIWYDYACALSRNRNIDEAFNALRKALDLGYTNFEWLKKDADLENLRQDKRFQEMIH